jgi:hypothetical protein
MDVVDRTESGQAAYRRSSLPRGVVAQQEIYLRIVPRTLPPVRPLCPSGGPPARGLDEMISSRGPDPSSVERESTGAALEGIKRAVDGHKAGRCGSWSGRPASHAHTGCRAPWPRATRWFHVEGGGSKKRTARRTRERAVLGESSRGRISRRRAREMTRGGWLWNEEDGVFGQRILWN